MTIYHKARELGELVAASEQALKRDAAKAAFQNDMEAVVLLEDFNDLRSAIQMQISTNSFTETELADSRNQLAEMSEKLRAHPVAGIYIEAENEFNRLVNQVIDIFKQTLLGDDASCGSSCKGCGKH